MEKKQGFFSALKDEVVRGLSPARSRSRSRSKSPARSGSPMSGLLRRKKSSSSSNLMSNPEPLIARSGSLRPFGETLTPLMEGPDPDGGELGESKRVGSGLGNWMKGQLSRAPSATSSGYGSSNSHSSNKRSDLRLLLGVMGAPLAPVHVSSMDPLPHLSIKDTPIVSLFGTIAFAHRGLAFSVQFMHRPYMATIMSIDWFLFDAPGNVYLSALPLECLLNKVSVSSLHLARLGAEGCYRVGFFFLAC